MDSDSDWLLDSDSGLYWNSLHRIWAKYSDNEWSYVDQQGNPITNPPSKPTTPPKDTRTRVTYQGVYEADEPGYSSDPKTKPSTNQDEDLPEEGELDSIEEALLDFHQSIPAPEPPRPSPIRLLALPQSRSASIDPNRNLLILQPGVHEPLVFGRDRTFEPSLRLKEMEVSKTHATIFWQDRDDPLSHGWYIVDNASTHGTFLSSTDDPTPTRLSKLRKASVPFKLRHLDTIYIASIEDPILALQVHLHPRFPSSCQSCALFPDESNRMSLEPGSRAAAVTRADAERGEERYAMSPADVKVERERKRKVEMAKLRSQFFGEEAEAKPKKARRGESTALGGTEAADGAAPAAGLGQYLDRAKLRRQTLGRSEQPGPTPPAVARRTPEPDPMQRGAALLAKLGGAAPDALQAMGKVIEPKTLGAAHAGLGSRQLLVGTDISAPVNWRHQAKLANWKRYDALKNP